jgi:hypothetical protein
MEHLLVVVETKRPLRIVAWLVFGERRTGAVAELAGRLGLRRGLAWVAGWRG